MCFFTVESVKYLKSHYKVKKFVNFSRNLSFQCLWRFDYKLFHGMSEPSFTSLLLQTEEKYSVSTRASNFEMAPASRLLTAMTAPVKAVHCPAVGKDPVNQYQKHS